MARFGFDQDGNGRLEVRHRDNEVDGFFVPVDPPAKGVSAADGVRILNFSPARSELRIFPINTLRDREGYLLPKYPKIHTLTLIVEERDVDDLDFYSVLDEELPRGFIKDYAYGLGLQKDCNRLVRLIEKHTKCDEISFMGGADVAVDGKALRLGLDRFDALWSEIQRINGRGHDAAARVKDAFVHNDLASTIQLEPVEFSLGRHPVSRVLTKAAHGVEELTEQEQDALIGAVASESAALAQTRPEKFLKLHRDVELVNLDRLILSYEDALGKQANEGFWQNFFDDNAFALQQVFGTPMVSVQSGATVGGGGFTGSGGKITDYLFKNSLTNNVALVEIKKPTTSLLGTTEYRSGVFGPSKELEGAITQVLDQAYQLSMNFPTMKNNSRQWDLESYAVSCFVIAGRTPSTDEPAKQKSFELYRANSRSVKVVTYDEILEQLKLLREFLLPQQAANASGEGS
ncbi:Shedu immune nuclease family protein [Rhodococcus sp. NPDC055112]